MPPQEHDDWLKTAVGVDVAGLRNAGLDQESAASGAGSGNPAETPSSPALAPVAAAPAPAPAGAEPWHVNILRPDINMTPQAQLDAGKTVPRATVEQALTAFLNKLQAAQKLQSGLRVTDRVRKAGEVLTEGIGEARSKVSTLLGDDKTLRKPSELAHAMAQCLPDQIPAANYADLVGMSPTDFAETQPQSLSDALAKQLDKTVDGILSGVGIAGPLRATVKKAMADALAAGITAALDKAMSDSQIPPGAQQALHSALEAALKQKDSGPPMDRAEDGAGSPDAPPPTPPVGPPPQAAPQPPPVPGETIVQTPPMNTPDTPPEQKKPQASP